MNRSKMFLSTSKEARDDAGCKSAELLYRTGAVHNYGSGVFGYSTFGKKLLDNISDIIKDEMEKIGCQEVLLNILQDSELWKKSGRWDSFDTKELFKLVNRDEKDFCLAATHEEAVVDMAKHVISSYRDLDFSVYQIGRKFRDDHARKGLHRAKEFHMKDAYSFHSSEKGLDNTFEEFEQAYRRIFERFGLDYSVVSADNGAMGGNTSKEFLVESEEGADTYKKCGKEGCHYGTKSMSRERCERCGEELRKVEGIELGHIFKLGTRYSEAMDLKYDTKQGDRELVQMGCYGIGVSRVIPAIFDTLSDSEGVRMNKELSVFDASIIKATDDEKAHQKAEKLHEKLKDDFEVVLYDSNTSTGEAFKESDFLGVRNKIILGSNFLKDGKIEVEKRDGSTEFVDEEDLKKELV